MSQPKEIEIFTTGEIKRLIQSATQTAQLSEVRHSFKGQLLTALASVVQQQQTELGILRARAEAAERLRADWATESDRAYGNLKVSDTPKQLAAAHAGISRAYVLNQCATQLGGALAESGEAQ